MREAVWWESVLYGFGLALYSLLGVYFDYNLVVIINIIKKTKMVVGFLGYHCKIRVFLVVLNHI